MACRYTDGTEINIGDTVQYETVEYEEGRGYGMYRTTKTARVREIKVIMENGDSISPNRLTKVAGAARASVARAAGEGSARKSRKTRKQRRNH